MPTDRTIDFVVMFLTIGLLALGLGSMAIGWAVRAWDRVMSRVATTVPVAAAIEREHGSDAAEQRGNGAELPSGTTFGTVVTYLEQCNDEQLLAILTELIDDTGDWRFAESRIAKFIPGRVEDRLAQVRAVRDTVPPPPPGRQLRVRDEQGERLIPMDA